MSADVASGSSRRGIAAPLLALLGGPVGHFAIGHWRRACFWLAGLVTLEGGVVAAAAAGQGLLFTVLLWSAFLLRAAMVVDVIKLERTLPLPPARIVLLLWVGMVAFYAMLAGQVRRHVVEFFAIPSGGMSPTLLAGDQVAVRKTTADIRRGDVVTFRYPLDHDVEYVKRVIGVGGDVVAGRAGHLFVNGQPLASRKLDQPCPAPTVGDGCAVWEESLEGRRWRVASSGIEPDFPELVVPAGTYFVVGDNRSASSDSRVWGPVDHDLVTGRAGFVWHWDRFGRPVD